MVVGLLSVGEQGALATCTRGFFPGKSGFFFRGYRITNTPGVCWHRYPGRLATHPGNPGNPGNPPGQPGQPTRATHPGNPGNPGNPGGEQAAHGARPPCGGGDAPSLGSSSREGVLRCSSEVTEATSASHSPPPPVRTGHPPSCEGAAPLTPPDRFTPRAFLFQSSIVLLSRLPDPQVAVSSVARLGIVAPARGRDNLTLLVDHARWVPPSRSPNASLGSPALPNEIHTRWFANEVVC